MDQNRPPFAFFLSLYVVLFFGVFYNTVTNLAGLYIVSDLGGDPHTSVYAMVFFGLGSALAIPLAMPFADRYGTVRVLVSSLICYACCAFFCATASTFFLLNLFRVGAGFAAGFFYMLIYRLMQRHAPPEKLPNYSFAMLLFFATVPVLGACIGGWVAYENHWRDLFYFPIPIALLLSLYFWRRYRYLDGEKKQMRIDKVGYLFFFLGLSALVTAATLAQELDWYRSTTWLILVIGGIPCLLFFILWSLKHPFPLLQFHLLKNPLLSFSLLHLAILFATYFGMIILVALWLHIYVNYTPVWIGVVLSTMFVTALIMFFMSKTYLSKIDPRFSLIFALLCFISSCYYSTYFDVEVDLFHLSVARSLSGMGLVLFLVPLFGMCTRSYGPEKKEEVFAFLQIARSLGSSLGAGLYMILWERRQAFFHERLGEKITATSQLTAQYFQKATQWFYLTPDRATEELSKHLTQQATSLALNDVFGAMGWIMVALLVSVGISFVLLKKLDLVRKHEV
jgi:MFS transporter, DHA2 family, multidrug resistance protein